MPRSPLARALALTLALLALAACSAPAPAPDASDARADAAAPPDVTDDDTTEPPDVLADAPTPTPDARDVALDVSVDAPRDVPGDCGSVAPDGACGPCPTGYELSGTRCVDIDECAAGTAGCDAAPGGRCTNTPGSFTCACAAGWTGTGTGAGSCLWNDPALLTLVPSAGTLSPAFAPGTTMYTLRAPGPSITLTATSAQPTRTTIRVNGATVGSGEASAAITVGLVPAPVTVAVETEGGATRTYTIVVSSQSAYVKASNTRGNSYFGTSVAISGDGSTLAVGSPLETSSSRGVGGSEASAGYDYAGAVYVYARTGSTWTRQAYVKASNTGIGQYFGQVVALSSDGSTLAVGAPGERSNATGIDGNQASTSAVGAGAVYVFTRTGTAWSQQAYVKASNTGAGDSFGYAIALSSDGSTLAVGAHNEDSSATGVDGNQADDSAMDSGAVYVFTRTGGAWSQQAYIKASNTGAADYFGLHLALSGDGTTLAVAAEREDSGATGVNGDQSDNSVTSAGAVYVFTRAGSAWTQQAYVKASNTGASDTFGTSVALSGDGSTLAVGAALEDSGATGVGGAEGDETASASGAVYVFTRAGSTWSQQAYVKASNTGANDTFGISVALSADGATLAVGAPVEGSNATGVNGDQANNAAPASGAVYVFTRTGSAWTQRAYVKASNTSAGDLFGTTLALGSSGATLAVGAPNEDSNATGIGGDEANNSALDSGAAYVY